VTRAPLSALALLLLLVACARGQGDSSSPGVSEGTSQSPHDSSSPRESASFSLAPASEQPGSGDTLTGRLGADAVEGGCAYLQAADQTRYEVLYPDGWTLQMAPLQLIGPDGEVHARAGDVVTVRGAIATDMASICQIGPIFRATAVVAP
jgi:hypothetical protein